jgi:hypothetical protein
MARRATAAKRISAGYRDHSGKNIGRRLAVPTQKNCFIDPGDFPKWM